MEAGCLAYLAVATTILRSFTLGREQCLEAIAIAEAHGWATEPIVVIAPAALAAIEVAQGRFDEARHWLLHAEHALRPGTGPAAELLLHLARGLLGSAKARLEEARNEFQAAQQLATALVARPALSAELRGLHIQTLVRLGDTSAARVRIGELTAHDRTSGATRVSLATLHLAEDNPEATVDVLAPVLDGSAPAMKITAVHASLLLALARDLLGDKEAAESSVERALELAEPDALVYPFVATPVRRLLENHPRHRTAHAALLSDILDVLAGSSLPTRPQPRQDLSDSELRVLRYLPSNLSAAEIGNQLYLSVTTIKTHMRHIYAKLGVHRRTEAVDRARELRLLAPSARPY